MADDQRVKSKKPESTNAKANDGAPQTIVEGGDASKEAGRSYEKKTRRS